MLCRKSVSTKQEMFFTFFVLKRFEMFSKVYIETGNIIVPFIMEFSLTRKFTIHYSDIRQFKEFILNRLLFPSYVCISILPSQLSNDNFSTHSSIKIIYPYTVFVLWFTLMSDKLTQYWSEDRMNDEWWTESDVEDTGLDLFEEISRRLLGGTKYDSVQFLSDYWSEYELQLFRYINLTAYAYALTVSQCGLYVHFWLLHLKLNLNFI